MDAPLFTIFSVFQTLVTSETVIEVFVSVLDARVMQSMLVVLVMLKKIPSTGLTTLRLEDSPARVPPTAPPLENGWANRMKVSSSAGSAGASARALSSKWAEYEPADAVLIS